jgi:hypothetical protein
LLIPVFTSCLTGKGRKVIEMGRFFSIDRSQRICDLCNKEELGDEFHYLFNCTFFKDERKQIIPEYLYNVSNTISFSELMNVVMINMYSLVYQNMLK